MTAADDRPTDVPHIIVLPGGGYNGLANHEGEPVAAWLRTLGVEASVHRYPVASLDGELVRHPGPIESVRSRVAELRDAGVQRLGILGFSAGGHLAGHAATSDLVDAAVLCYPVVSMQLPTHAGSRQNLLGRFAAPWRRKGLSIDQRVSASTPPMFVWHTADDAVVPVEHSYRLALALAANAVPHELHVYPHGRHGLGLATGEPSAAWTAACAAWLGELGWAPSRATDQLD